MWKCRRKYWEKKKLNFVSYRSCFGLGENEFFLSSRFGVGAEGRASPQRELNLLTSLQGRRGGDPVDVDDALLPACYV